MSSPKPLPTPRPHVSEMWIQRRNCDCSDHETIRASSKLHHRVPRILRPPPAIERCQLTHLGVTTRKTGPNEPKPRELTKAAQPRDPLPRLVYVDIKYCRRLIVFVSPNNLDFIEW
ncbi:unnamed protein product [Vicia faba]|uniref:Uncharacterized protein n=1 Tax=Vicia faba TaxID=3906 RepID=A0AAV0ZEW3_VICFA|nr:unnamed protein product [Vicia faba]